MFELQFEPLIINDKLKLWEIALVPWDTETFGFGVSVLNPVYDDYSDGSVALAEALKSYSHLRSVEVITASIPSDQNVTSLLLQQAGFRFIDQSLSIRYENLNDIIVQQSPKGLSLAPASLEEIDVLAEMAGRTFQHGRYHQDIQIPQSLADKRYKDWVSRCCDPENRQQILVVKFQEVTCGFSVVECRGQEGYLHLHAMDSKWRGRKLGVGMIVESLRYLHEMGAECVGTKISASNLKALNMHSRLKGRFVSAEYLLHWHREEK